MHFAWSVLPKILEQRCLIQEFHIFFSFYIHFLQEALNYQADVFLMFLERLGENQDVINLYKNELINEIL